MKHKALLIGKNNTIIDDFFSQMSDEFEVITASTRYEDLIRHLHYFKPDLCIYCMHNESTETFSQMRNIQSHMSRLRIPLILIGFKEECDEFHRVASNVPNYPLIRPLTADMIRSKILRLVSRWNRKPKSEERERIPEDLEALLEAERQTDGTYSEAVFDPEAEYEFEPAVAPKAEAVQRKQILVVDDSPLMLKLLKENLRGIYDVATAISGQIALKFLQRKHADLILLDYEMPEESGPVVLEKIRANPDTSSIPVIFLTGVTDSGKIKEALVLKPQGYLLKPIDHDKLIETISGVIG